MIPPRWPFQTVQAGGCTNSQKWKQMDPQQTRSAVCSPVARADEKAAWFRTSHTLPEPRALALQQKQISRPIPRPSVKNVRYCTAEHGEKGEIFPGMSPGPIGHLLINNHLCILKRH